MARFIKHGPCPHCGSRDNMGHYDDGSSFCFGCHKSMAADRFSPLEVLNERDSLQVPDDLSFDYPRHVVEWLGRYGISVEEGIKHGWKYSKRYDQLIFIYHNEGEVACTQARNFREGAKKYFNQGSPKDVRPIFYCPALLGLAVGTLVITEDALSAAKIARQSDAMPCLGSYLPVRKIIALKALGYEQLVVWLDHDKLKEAWEIENMAKWIGLSSRTIYTELDPKEYTDAQIKCYLFPSNP